MRRKVLVLAAGISFLVLMSWIGALVSSIEPRDPTAQVQSAQAGRYHMILQVNPNPPLITKLTTLTVQLTPVSAQVQVKVELSMVEMDMGTASSSAQEQTTGSYRTQVQFPMSGSWHIRVLVEASDQPSASATFTVTVR